MKPVAYIPADGLRRMHEHKNSTATVYRDLQDGDLSLYTRPEPLSDERIAAMWRACCEDKDTTTAALVRNFARAIERALFEGE